MKPVKSHALLIVLLVFVFAACNKKDEIAAIPEEKSNASHAELLLQRLHAYGFPKDKIVDDGKYYIVDGDIRFDKERADIALLDAMFDKKDDAVVLGKVDGSISQAHTNNLVSNANVNAIAFNIVTGSGGLDYSWYNAIYEAAGHWNQISNTRINMANYGQFQVDANVNITFRHDGNTLPSNVIAAAEFPNSVGAPGFQVLVNTDFNGNNYNYSQMVYNMVHEIGHCLGLRHTNWAARGEGSSPVGANHIPGTPVTDANSVMNGGTALNTWNGFSTWDIFSAQYLYPWSQPVDSWLTAPDQKFPNNTLNMADDQSLYVAWNAALVNTPTVTLRLYQHGVLQGNLGVNLPNNGSASFSRLFVMQLINWEYLYTEGNFRIEIVSDANPSITDWTGYFNMRLNS